MAIFLQAQNPLIKQWDKRYGGSDQERIATFLQTTDGGFLLGGQSHSPLSGDKTQPNWNLLAFTDDFWVIKIDSLGNKEWDKRYGGVDDEGVTALRQTVDGGYILGGSTSSGVSGDKTQPSQGQYDYWIVKIDAVGNMQWDKRFGGLSYDLLYSIIQTTDGGYLLGGFSASDSSGDKTQNSWGLDDYWIIKVDSLGNKQWDKRFGGTGNDNFYSMINTSDGGFMLGGWSNSPNNGDKTQVNWGAIGTSDYWIIKIDSSGNKLWDKRFGGTNSDYLTSLQQTKNGEYILGGTSTSDSSGDKSKSLVGVSDMWIIKIDSFGNKEWDNAFGGSDQEDLSDVMQTLDEGFFIVGTSYSNISGDKTEDNLGLVQTWILKTNSIGDKLWDKTIFTNGTDWQGFGFQTKNGDYAIANCSDGGVAGYKTQPTRGSNDYWIVIFGDTSTSTNCYSYFSNVYDSIYNTFYLSIDSISQNLAASFFWDFGDSTTSTLQFPSHVYLTNSIYNVCLTITDSIGDTCSYCHLIGIDSSGIVHTLINSGFTLIVNNGSVGVNELLLDNFSIYPNPTKGEFSIALDKLYTNINVEVSDINGKLIYSEKRKATNHVSINIKVAPGIYFATITLDGSQKHFKIVME